MLIMRMSAANWYCYLYCTYQNNGTTSIPGSDVAINRYRQLRMRKAIPASITMPMGQ